MKIKRVDHPLPVPADMVQILIEADQLFEVVAAACQLQLFDSLSKPCSVPELAVQRDIDETTTRYLLNVLAYAGYLSVEYGLYKNTPVSEAYLHTTSIAYLGHNFLLQKGAVEEQLLQCLASRGGSRNSPEPDWGPEKLRQIGVTGLQGSIQATVGAVDLSGAKNLLDLGGGHGLYSIAFAQKYPALQVTLFDLEQVIPLAENLISQFELLGHIKTVAGNFLTDSIGHGFDAILCANILHREKRGIVLPKVYNAISHGGQIIVKCRVRETENTFSASLAKLLWHIRGGKEFKSQEQWWEILEQYGFTDIRTVLVEGIFATIVGHKA